MCLCVCLCVSVCARTHTHVCMHPGSKWKSAWQKALEESQGGSLEPSVCTEYRIASLAPYTRWWVRVRVRHILKSTSQ